MQLLRAPGPAGPRESTQADRDANALQQVKTLHVHQYSQSQGPALTTVLRFVGSSVSQHCPIPGEPMQRIQISEEVQELLFAHEKANLPCRERHFAEMMRHHLPVVL